MVNVDNEGNVTAAAQGILQPKGILQNLVVLLVKNTPCLYSPLSHKCQVGAQATNATDFPISDLHQRLCLRLVIISDPLHIFRQLISMGGRASQEGWAGGTVVRQRRLHWLGCVVDLEELCSLQLQLYPT